MTDAEALATLVLQTPEYQGNYEIQELVNRILEDKERHERENKKAKEQ
jgi:hypothetical protein